MVNRLPTALRAGAAALTATLLLTGCEELVYKDRELFNPPPDTTSGFLGYFNVASKQTTCGNCHVSFQAQWKETKHAQAAGDLEASGQAQGFCWGCHAVSELGNAVTVKAGYNLVSDSAYRDVQCESCHGPGYTHVQNPSRDTRPLASIKVAEGLTNGCGECHSGEHTPYLEQWAESKHGYGGGAYLVEGGRSPCNTCHEGRAAIRLNFGETTNYVEQADTGVASYQPILCATCHDPHSAANEGQLRAPLSEPSREQLCVQCHSRQGAPTPGSATRRGPHAAQGLLVIGDDAVGWIPPNFTYTGPIVSTHGSEANPRLCAACHVSRFEVTTAEGEFFNVGHTFEAIQCLDAQGVPTAGPCTVDQRYFGGCVGSGCHGSVTTARSAFVAVEARMNTLTDLLWTDTDADATMEATDGGLLPKVLAQAIAANNKNVINLYDGTLTVAEGAIWNAQLAFTHDRGYWSSFTVTGQLSCTPTTTCTTTGSPNTAHKSSGEGVHNPFLLEALLTASIQAVQTTYGLAPDMPVDLTVQATPPPGVRVRNQ